MADPRVEILIQARDEASAAIQRAIRQVQSLGTATRQTRTEAATLSRFGDALGAISPAAASAASQVRSLTGATAGLGVAATVALGAAAALLALGAGAAVAVRGVAQLADQAEQLGNLAQKAGISASNLQALRLQAEQSGVAAESLSTGIRFLNRSIAEQDPALRRLGVTQRDTYEALLQLADAFSRAPDGPAKTKVAMDLLGRGGADLIPILNQGGAALRAFVGDAKATGAVLNDETVGSFQNVDDAIDKMNKSLRQLGNAFITYVAPAVEVAAIAIVGLIESLKLIPLLVGITVEALRAFGLAITAWIASIVERVPGAALVLQRLGVSSEQSAEKAEQSISKLIGQVEALASQALKVNASSEGIKSFGDDMRRAMEDAAGGTGKAKASLQDMLDLALKLGSLPPTLELRPTRARPGQLDPGSPVPVPKLQLDADGLADVAQEWQAAMDNITSAAQIMESSLQAVFSGVQAGLSAVVGQLLNGTKLAKVQLDVLWKSIVDSILAELQRLVAAQITKLFLKLIATALGVSNPAVGAILSLTPGGGGGGGGTGGLTALAPAGAAPSLARAGTTVNVNISALDARSVTEQLTSPFGAMRRSFADLGTLAAY